MLCLKCSECSWQKDLDFCGGLSEFEWVECPIEKRLSRTKSESEREKH